MDDKATLQTQSRYSRRMDLFDPFVMRLMGPHINRRTVENVRKADLEIERVEESAQEV